MDARTPVPLVPAKAGTQQHFPKKGRSFLPWIPACAGMSGEVREWTR